MANGGGYGVGLFDKSGPEGFATAVKGIGTELGTVASGFNDLASKASDALGRISKGIDDVVKKLQGLSGGVTAAAAGGGGGGGGGGVGPGKTNVSGAPGWNVPPPSQGGPASQGNPLAGMPQGSASQLMGQFFQWMQEGSTTGAQAALGANMVGGAGNGMPQFSASRAAQSMIPAAAGAAIKAVTSGPGQSLIANAIQGTTIGQMWGSGGAFGVSDRSLYQAPQGTLQTSAGDYAQANYYALTQMGIAPGTQNWSTIQRGAQALMPMVPGMSRQGAFAVMNQMQQASTLQAGFRVGLNLRPGGNIMDPQAQFGQIFNRLTMGNKVSADTFWKSLQPGAPGAANLAMLGITPGSDTYNAFLEYAQQALKSGGTANMPDMSTAQGRKTAGLDTPYMSQLQAQSKLSRAEQGMEPGIADAAKNLNNAAAALLQLATGPMGGLGGMLGGASNLLGGGGMMGLGLGMGALGIARRIPGISGLLGRIPGIGGMLGNKWGFSKAAGRLGARGLGKIIPGRLGGWLGGLGGGGGEAAAAGGAEAVAGEAGTAAAAGGLEAAGLGFDATGVGLPIGLGLAAAGGLLAFHKPIGHFLSGLFGHHKKQSTSGADGGGSGDDMASLLSSPPPKGSLIEILTSPGGGIGGAGGVAPTQHRHKGLFGSIGEMAGGMLKGLPGIGGAFGAAQSLMSGGGISGAMGAMLSSFINPLAGLGQVVGGAQGIGGALASFFGGTAASAQTASTPYQWNAKNLQSTPNNLSGLFQLYRPGMAPASQGGSSSDTSGGSGSTGGGTPLTGSSYAQQVWNFFTAKGLKDYMVAGIIGNMAQESNVNPESTGMGGGGLVGFTPLPKGFVTGNAQTDMITQLNYLWGQLTGSESGALAALQGTTNASDAATTFMNKYERPAVATENAAHRVAAAQNALKSKGAGYARGTQLVARTGLALLHSGEAVVPAADNYGAGGTYNRAGAMGGGAGTVYLNFRQGSIVLQVSNNPSQTEMDNVAKMFVTSISKPQVLAGIRST